MLASIQRFLWFYIILSILTLVQIKPAWAQKKRDFLVGRWVEIEYNGNTGVTDYTTPIKHGETYIFKKNNVFKSSNGHKGSYQLKGDSLCIMMPKRKIYYSLWKSSSPNRLVLVPRNEDYTLICDDGCSLVFKRRKLF